MTTTVSATQTVHEVGPAHFIGVTRTVAWDGREAWDVTEASNRGWVQHSQHPDRAEAELIADALAAARPSSCS